MPKFERGVTYVVITHNGYWGKARTLPEAMQNCGLAFPTRATLFRFPHALVDPESIEITAHGSVRWEWAAKPFRGMGADVVTLGTFEISKHRNLTVVDGL